MIPRWPAPRTRRTERRRRATGVIVAALLAAFVQPPAAHASAPPAPPSDAKLAATPARHDDTREQFYFVMPDRFANGDTSNDQGGLTGSRLSTGYDPTDKGFYQGGDLKGLTKKLDYIKGLGTTAIWMAPIFKNQPVQGTGAGVPPRLLALGERPPATTVTGSRTSPRSTRTSAPTRTWRPSSPRPTPRA